MNIQTNVTAGECIQVRRVDLPEQITKPRVEGMLT